MPSPPQIHDLEAWEEYYRGLERTIPTGIEKSTGAHPFGAGLLNFRCLRSARFMGTRRNATRSSVEFHGISIRIHPLFYPVKFEGKWNERNEAANESRWERWRSWLIPLAKIDWLAFLDVLRPGCGDWWRVLSSQFVGMFLKIEEEMTGWKFESSDFF